MPENNEQSELSFDVSITIGVDGRIYCHDITPQLFPVLAAICGNDGELAARQIPDGTEEICDS